MNKVSQVIFIVLVFILALQSCKDDFFYQSKVEFENKTWSIDKNAVFSLKIDDSKSAYGIFIDVVCSENYLTNNLWLEFSIKSPQNVEQKDTIMYKISDETGRWFGKKESEIIINKFLYKNNIHFPENGNYEIKLRHLMRAEDEPVLQSVGITVAKYE